MSDLKEKLETYGEQLEQVEALLQSDPANAQYLKLKEDLVEVRKLTEDLLRYKDDLAFGVGTRCEAVYQDQWYPAVITGMTSEAYTVVFIGFGNTETVDQNGVRPLVSEETVDPSTIAPGFECSARYSGDGKYYAATVSEITDFGYRVTFTEYGNVEEVPLEYIKGGGEVARSADGWKLPDHLRVLASDSEAERQRKRRKVKALKQQVKTKERNQETDAKQSNWLQFQNKGAKRKVVGSMKQLRKNSIFESPDSVDGKVGVTGSGKGVTDYGDRKKFKFREPPDLR